MKKTHEKNKIKGRVTVFLKSVEENISAHDFNQDYATYSTHFFWNLQKLTWRNLAKSYRVFSSPYFPVFGLSTGIYGVNLLIRSRNRKIRTRKNSVFGHISRSVWFAINNKPLLKNEKHLCMTRLYSSWDFWKNTFRLTERYIQISILQPII